MKDQETFSRLENLFKSYPQIIAAYFYGSQVGGYASSKSDLDVAVVVEDFSAANYGNLYLEASQVIKDKEIDLRVVTRETSPTFIFQMIRNGRCIYQRNNLEKVQFEVKALGEYYDGEHTRRIYDNYLKSYFNRGQI